MRVKLILPALVEARSPLWRPVKYSLFPPLGLAALAAYLDDADEVTLQDEHVEPLDLDDEPHLVVLQVYVTSAHRAYEIADGYRRRGVHVVLGGLHPTSCPEEAAQHADTVCLGPGEDTWPAFLADFRAGRPRAVYRSVTRTLDGAPPPRRELFRRELYLVPNSLVVSRGCPHGCDFCYKNAFFAGGKSFYTRAVDAVLTEIESLPGRHLYFLDDHLLAAPRFAAELFRGMRGMGRVWQAAATVPSLLRPHLLDMAVEAGLRSVFVGLETLSAAGLREQHKGHNQIGDYTAAVGAAHGAGVMINGSFVFGMDDDDRDTFARTVDWAVAHGIETATFHILTPYPGTALHQRLAAAGRITTRDWDFYDTRHAVYRPARMSATDLEAGYWQAYRDFYRWSAIAAGAMTKPTWLGRAKHLAYAGAWKRAEPLWNLLVRRRRVAGMLPALEWLLAAGG